MFRNYLKTAIRNFLKNKVITIITMLGLSIGISAALVIYQIVQYDYSFDKYEPDQDRIYRIVTKGPNWNNSGVPAPLHRAVRNTVTGITTTAGFFRFNGWPTISIPQNNNQPAKKFKEQKDIVFANKNYFQIFPRQWIVGSASASLQSPFQIVLSKSRAQLYFPGLSMNQIIGKQLIISDTLSAVVSGIVKDLSVNSDFDYKVFIALSTLPHSGLKKRYNWDEWNGTNSISQLFVKLSPGTLPQQINKQVTALFTEHSSGDFSKETSHHLQPLSNIHFNTDYGGSTDKSILRNLVLLAVFLLLLGAINFINLSTAQAIQRAKEIGIRKTLGSTKGQLIRQFLTETFMLTLLATILSVFMLPLLLNAFSGYIPEGLTYNGIGHPDIILFLCTLVVVVSLLSGLYPAFVLTRFKPVTVMRNQAAPQSGQSRNAWIRKTLIVTQFIIAQVFIISVLMVNKQIHYAINKDMGFKQNGIINFYVPSDFYHPERNHKNILLRNRLRTLPGIAAVSLGNQSPAFSGWMTTTVEYQKGKDEITIRPDTRNGDTAYLGLYHIQLLAGRNVLPADSATELLINEALMHRMGYQHPQKVIGQFLKYDGRDLPIVGVMKDFNESSVRRAIKPLLYSSDLQYGYVMHIALKPNNQYAWQKTIARIKNTWQSMYPDKDFDYTFLDQTIAKFYKKSVRLSKLLAWSAGIAIFIGCLGLLGLVIFMANQRTKEIGIRKVLGASVTQIITLLSKDFIALVAIAFVLAVPIAWIIMNKWLQNFAYHTSLSWWVFVVSGIAMLIIALIILGIRAGRAAMANPVKSLRTE